MPDAACRPRRSALFLPATNQRALAKARTLPCDVVIVDLEDAVSPEQKDEARASAEQALLGGGFGSREVVVRINALSTPWGSHDLAMVQRAHPDAVLVPKVATSADLEPVGAALAASGSALWAMLETARGVLGVERLVSALPQLSCLVMGTSDLTAELHARTTTDRLPLVTALQLAVLAARAWDRVILDGVHLGLDDGEGFRAACEQGRAFGFDGKTLIHPSQIEAANAAFAPDDDEIAASREIIEAFEAAEREGRGVATVNGRMIENLHVENAQRVLAMADAIAAAGG